MTNLAVLKNYNSAKTIKSYHWPHSCQCHSFNGVSQMAKNHYQTCYICYLNQASQNWT